MTTNHPTPRQSAGRWTGRTRFVTAASIDAVGIAGAVAIGANIGILDAAENNNIGELSAAGDLTETDMSPQVIEVYLPGAADPATEITDPAVIDTARAGAPENGLAVESSGVDASETFAVDAAGTVTIGRTANGLRLESIDPSAGWTWQLSQPDPTSLTVTLTDGTRTLGFTATLGADGSITPEVIETVNEPAGSSNPSSYEDDDEGDDEHEDEHEGSDDDD